MVSSPPDYLGAHVQDGRLTPIWREPGKHGRIYLGEVIYVDHDDTPEEVRLAAELVELANRTIQPEARRRMRR